MPFLKSLDPLLGDRVIHRDAIPHHLANTALLNGLRSSGKVVQGKRGFFKFGILPEIRINRLKLVLQQGTSLKAIATLLKEGKLLGKQAGKMEIAHFELCSIEHGDTPLLVIKDLKLGGKKTTGKLLAQSTTHPLPTEFKALLK